MSYSHFAHTQPVWIDQIGSIEPEAARAAANDLLKALTYSKSKFAEGYGASVPSGLMARIAKFVGGYQKLQPSKTYGRNSQI